MSLGVIGVIGLLPIWSIDRARSFEILETSFVSSAQTEISSGNVNEYKIVSLYNIESCKLIPCYLQTLKL